MSLKCLIINVCPLLLWLLTLFYGEVSSDALLFCNLINFFLCVRENLKFFHLHILKVIFMILIMCRKKFFNIKPWEFVLKISFTWSAFAIIVKKYHQDTLCVALASINFIHLLNKINLFDIKFFLIKMHCHYYWYQAVTWDFKNYQIFFFNGNQFCFPFILKSLWTCDKLKDNFALHYLVFYSMRGKSKHATRSFTQNYQCGNFV